MSGPESSIGLLLAEREIRDVLARFSAALDRQDAEEWLTCFSRSGSYQFSPVEGMPPQHQAHGQAALRSWFTEHCLSHPRGWQTHVDCGIRVDLTGPGATATATFLVLLAEDDGLRVLMSGTYRDRLVHELGAWRIAAREATGLSVPTSWTRPARAVSPSGTDEMES